MLPKTPIETLQSKTVIQLKADLTADLTKRDLLILANGSDKLFDEPVRIYGKGNQILSETQIIRDVETNALISTKEITWTYYPTGEVDEITILEFNSKGEVILAKTIKHFTDGRQPAVEEIYKP